MCKKKVRLKLNSSFLNLCFIVNFSSYVTSIFTYYFCIYFLLILSHSSYWIVILDGNTLPRVILEGSVMSSGRPNSKPFMVSSPWNWFFLKHLNSGTDIKSKLTNSKENPKQKVPYQMAVKVSNTSHKRKTTDIFLTWKNNIAYGHSTNDRQRYTYWPQPNDGMYKYQVTVKWT